MLYRALRPARTISALESALHRSRDLVGHPQLAQHSESHRVSQPDWHRVAIGRGGNLLLPGPSVNGASDSREAGQSPPRAVIVQRAPAPLVSEASCRQPSPCRSRSAGHRATAFGPVDACSRVEAVSISFLPALPQRVRSRTLTRPGELHPALDLAPSTPADPELGEYPVRQRAL